MEHHPDSLLAHVQTIPDPRRRQGRKYPLPALLGVLLLGVVHGHDSLRGAWLWASHHWPHLWRPLGARSPHYPCYQTVRGLLSRLDADAVDRAVRPWVEQVLDQPEGGISADGKRLRGSKRDDLPGRHLVSLVTHELGAVVAQREAVNGDEVTALLALLTEVPLRGRTLTADAGLLTAAVTQAVQAQDGAYLGLLKGNHPEVKAVCDDWVATEVFSPCGHHGRAQDCADRGAAVAEAAAGSGVPGALAAAAARAGCGHLGERARAAGVPRSVGGGGRRIGAVSGRGMGLAGHHPARLGAALSQTDAGRGLDGGGAYGGGRADHPGSCRGVDVVAGALDD